MNKYTITMSDGIVLDNLTMNGNMYVSQTEIALEDLNAETLASVTIVETDDGGSHENTYMNMVCDGVLHWPEGWMFNLREMTQQEIERMELEMRLEEAEAALIELAGLIGGME